MVLNHNTKRAMKMSAGWIFMVDCFESDVMSPPPPPICKNHFFYSFVFLFSLRQASHTLTKVKKWILERNLFLNVRAFCIRSCQIYAFVQLPS